LISQSAHEHGRASRASDYSLMLEDEDFDLLKDATFYFFSVTGINADEYSY